MKKWQRTILWDLYDLTNKMGGVVDLTAVNPTKLCAYSEAHGMVSKIIGYVVNDEKENAEKFLNELRFIASWNYPDRHGILSDEEKRLNEILLKRKNPGEGNRQSVEY